MTNPAFFNSVSDALHDPSIISGLRQSFLTPDDELSEVPPVAEAEETLRWTQEVLDRLAAAVTPNGDPDDVETTLAIRYLDLRGQVMTLTARARYESDRYGSVDASLTRRIAACHAIVDRLETVLRSVDASVDRLGGYLKAA